MALGKADKQVETDTEASFQQCAASEVQLQIPLHHAGSWPAKQMQERKKNITF